MLSALLAALVMNAVVVVGDGMPAALGAAPGDAERGRAIVGSREQGMCLLCHNGPAAAFPQERTPGNVAGSLAGVGSRYSTAQLRLRVANARALNAGSVMPVYFRSEGDTPDPAARIPAAWQGRHLLTAQQLEDVVAFLQTLK